jgi:hypothetical protein
MKMSRSISIVAVVLLSAGVAYGQVPGEVVSYYGTGSTGLVIIDEVPADGFVLTDVVAGYYNSDGHWIELVEQIDGNADVVKLGVKLGGAAYATHSLHLDAGIPLVSSPQSATSVLALWSSWSWLPVGYCSADSNGRQS